MPWEVERLMGPFEEIDISTSPDSLVQFAYQFRVLEFLVDIFEEGMAREGQGEGARGVEEGNDFAERVLVENSEGSWNNKSEGNFLGSY